MNETSPTPFPASAAATAAPRSPPKSPPSTGVDSVDVDLDTKLVRISGENLDDSAIVARQSTRPATPLPISSSTSAEGVYPMSRIRRAWRYIIDRPLV